MGNSHRNPNSLIPFKDIYVMSSLNKYTQSMLTFDLKKVIKIKRKKLFYLISIEI